MKKNALRTIQLKDRLDLAQEFFRWEVATALAGAVLGINPFDQPNVQESKKNTNRLLKVAGENDRLREDPPGLTDGNLQLYPVSGSAEGTFARALVRFFRKVRPGDYIALLAYLSEEAAVESLLDSIRLRLQQQFGTAVTMGYGPRYLHSTGQYHKGGPDSGVFMQLTCDDGDDIEIPGRPYSFGTLRRAQAQGDLEALDGRGRRVLRLHLGADAANGLARLRLMLEMILPELGQRHGFDMKGEDMNKKDEYIEMLHDKIDEWNADIDKLTAKANQIEADSRIEYLKQIDALKQKQSEIDMKLAEMKRSGEEAWGDIKTGMDLVWDSMNEAVKSAVSRFKSS